MIIFPRHINPLDIVPVVISSLRHIPPLHIVLLVMFPLWIESIWTFFPLDKSPRMSVERDTVREGASRQEDPSSFKYPKAIQVSVSTLYQYKLLMVRGCTVRVGRFFMLGHIHDKLRHYG